MSHFVFIAFILRFRKQTGKEQKSKDAGNTGANAKELQPKDVKDGKKDEKTLKEPPKEIKDRSRSPSPGSGDRENREKDKENAPQENRDGSWFGGE